MAQPIHPSMIEDSDTNALLTVRRPRRGGYAPFGQRGEQADQERALLADLQQSQRSLLHSEALYRSLVETLADAFILRAQDGTIVMANRQAARTHGYDDPAALIGLNVIDLIAPQDRPKVQRNRKALAMAGMLRNLDYLGLRKDGTTCPEEISVSVIPSTEDQPAAAVVKMRHITERKALEEQLRYQALHDLLTGLPNATWLHQRLEETLASLVEPDPSCALLLLDLVGFKEINDTFGHEHGNRLLQQLSARLGNQVGESGSLARFTGDSFAVVLPGVDATSARRAADEIVQAVSEPFVIDGQGFRVEGTVGIALFPEHGADADSLLRCAGVAMTVARRDNSAHIVYRPEQDTFTAARLNLLADLHHAVERRDLVLHFQPKVSLATGLPEGAEALLRWQHPRLGNVPPGDFIPLAEHTSLIKPLTLWTIEEAIRQSHEWHEKGIESRIAVNLSVRILLDEQTMDAILRLYEQLRPEARASVMLEVTESAVMSDPQRALEAVMRLHEMGVRISIDDFGTGYSSLAYLGQLPVDEIKIDRSFIRAVTSNQRNQFIAGTIIELGHHLGLDVVAEGAEDEETCRLLAEAGCDIVQGYFIGRPMPAESYEAWLRAAQWAWTGPPQAELLDWTDWLDQWRTALATPCPQEISRLVSAAGVAAKRTG
jgi:diguanylate cyclase (GGDEF)-like protein/PAS domain S-box-containing protein